MYGCKIVDTLDAERDFVYSTFKLLHSNLGRSINADCVFAALLPLSHLQAPRRVGGIFHSAGGWPPWRVNAASLGETRIVSLRGPGAAGPGDPE